jgi:hypothetical protein
MFLVVIPILPDASVAMMVIVVDPKSEQSTSVGVIVMVGDAVQLSVANATIVEVTTFAKPFEPSVTVTGDVIGNTTGAMLSTTVTEVVAVVVLPDASVAVTVTVFEPRSEQPKVLGDTLNVTPPQLSEAELTS